jgi:uncharacterized C2H2 Zn-finger protein
MKNNPQNDENAFSQELNREQRICACGCGEVFIYTRKWQKYLNKEHRKKGFESRPRINKVKVDRLQKLLNEASEILETL